MVFTSQPQPPSQVSLSVHVRVRSALRNAQQYLFTGDDCDAGALVRLAEEFCTIVAQTPFHNFRIRRDLERSVPAVLRNIRQGFWRLAAKAATAAAGLLGFAGSRGFGPREQCVEAANLALRIAQRCEAAERRVRRQGLTADYVRESYERDRLFYARNAARARYGRAQEADGIEWENHWNATEPERVARGGRRG